MCFVEVEPIKDAKVPTYKVTVKAVGTAGQPVTSLRLLLDGRSFPNGEYSIPNGGVPNVALFQTTWNVTMPPGKHELKVLVRGPDTADRQP